MTAATPVIFAPSGRPARTELRNYYEAAQPSRARSYLPIYQQDIDRDLCRYTREQLAEKSLYLYKNSPFIRGLIERLVTYTVGTGIYPVPATSDKEWNRKTAQVWKGWMRRCEVNSKRTFAQYQRIVARARFLSGEAFTVKTYGPSGRPRVQVLAYHKICGKTDESKRIYDGIAYDKFGRPVSYEVKIARDKSLPYDAESIVHHFTPVFPGQRRGEPILAAAINTAHDVDDILTLEKAAVKDASSKRDIVKTASGEVPNAEEMIRQARLGLTGDPGVFEPDAEDYYRRVLGPETVTLRHGDEYTPYKSERPGPAWQGFMDFLSQTVCLSANIPPSILLQIKVGGADTRRDLAAAQRAFELWQIDLIQEFQDIYEYVIESEINDGPLMGAPNDWREASWQTPKAITVDAGREAQADREDVRSGLLSRREYWGRYGMNAEDEDAQIISEAKRRKGEIEASGLSVKEFVELLTLDPGLFKSAKPQQGNETLV